jgi:hypothetical protein
MNKYASILIFNFLLFSSTGYAQNNELRYEILLTRTMLSDSVFGSPLSEDLEISGQNLIALSDGSQMYLLGWAGVATIGNKSAQTISGFTYTPEGLLLTVQNKNLCYLNTEGNWQKLYELPFANMLITSGKEVLYIFDNDKNKNKYNAFALAKGGKYKWLFASPKPINGICELGDSIYVAIETGIYSYSRQKNKLSLLAAFKKGESITSLTADPKRDILYFSTPAYIYALKNNSLVSVTNEFPGSMVQYFGDGLFLFNASTGDILRIVNIHYSIVF